jgi:NADH:ubiquinone oxidoreductase subunit F (NADH-binding)
VVTTLSAPRGAGTRSKFLRRDPRHLSSEASALIDTVERARIHGRGGGAYPTATKLRAVATQPAAPAVVVNICEGEPLSLKHRHLLKTSVDTVLDGAFAVATALSARELVVALDAELAAQTETITELLARRERSARGRLSTRVALVPSGYVSGQETALISALSGQQPKPKLVPPYPFQSGLNGRPTFVSNIETFSQIGRAVSGRYHGTRLVTVSGAVKRPGIATVAPQTTCGELLQLIGGPTEQLRGVLLGGYGGSWAHQDQLRDLRLDEFELRGHGLTLGPGIVFMLGESSCAVAEVARVTRWMASQSAGQCGPCVRGVSGIADALMELTAPRVRASSYARIERWSQMIKGRGACAHPDGVSRFVTTALETFSDEFDQHARSGGCELCGASHVLPTPRLRRRPAPEQAGELSSAATQRRYR